MSVTALRECDVAVVGAGPAGMTAAVAAASSGASVLVIDDNPQPGGQIWRAGPAANLPKAALALRASLAQCSTIQVCSGTTIVALAGEKQFLLEDAQGAWHLRWNKLILCTGGRELLLPFPGWTLPGVTGAGGLQALIKGGVPVAGERVVIAGSGPLLLASAAAAAKAGAYVALVAEQASFASVAGFALGLWAWPAKLAQAAALAQTSYRTGTNIVSATGRERLEAVTVVQGGHQRDIACDRLAYGYGLVPNTGLGQALGCKLTPMQGFTVNALQESSVADIYAAGECTGIGGSERALVQGSIAGYAAVNAHAQAQQLAPQLARWQGFAQRVNKAFALPDALKALPDATTVVCRCESVPHGALTNRTSWTDAKLHTRCGMGTCQGRICSAATQFLFGWAPPVPRPPFTPARVSTLAAVTFTEPT